ncbi:MAG: hypothetical protein JNN24_03325 [Hyphomicrobium zavarzinii]|jgi:hypothetical protein|uniref:hypothetical protein n=1 Tax=Hyphomicrobium zavarzinii TaxID=48292 RepID=UPI001A3AE119|nr:hypothetical protein [Hyphomicrobium zavarzinii]MBL8844781.1 hypothetical protein [Hyphomicrobium zavarzinii]
MNTIEQRAMAWMMGDDTGASSETIVRHMLGLPQTGPFGGSAPADNWDLGRCLRLLALIPEWEQRLPEMASLGAVWAALIERWAELKALMVEETGPAFDREAPAPNTYTRMKAILKDAYNQDGYVELAPGVRMRARA